jgi:ABC-type oligopeptide transport system ATPase subunit
VREAVNRAANRGVSPDANQGDGFGLFIGPFTGGRLLRAFVDVDVTVEKGDVLGIVGESGSGKSTYPCLW